MGSCFNHFEEAVNLADELKAQKRRHQQPTKVSPGLKSCNSEVSLMPVFQSSAGADQSLMEVDELVVGENDPVVGALDEPMEIDHQLQIQDEINHARPFVEVYEGSAKTYGEGTTFLTQFDSDRFSRERIDNLYYPFASRDEWKLASFLLNSNLSMRAIDAFLSLDHVRLSYR